MSSNAWDRAQRAISRAEERDAAVVTPDNAVSPFDASATTVIPHADLPGARGRHQRPEDATTEVHGTADGARSGRRRRPSPRPSADEPPTAPVELAADRPGTVGTDGTDGWDPADDAPTESVATTPGPPARPRVALRARPDTAPFEAAGPTRSEGGEASGAHGDADPEVVEDADPPRRGFWARLFRRR